LFKQVGIFTQTGSFITKTGKITHSDR